ncbi:hypothetical protein EDB86DRAFT_3243064 [Lactarius hatsudake]|nr:hypothetical protein EDB86DRAFT_3243064 [Lactarius hatsudake]
MARVTRQRPVVRVCAELALVSVIRDAPGRSGGEWIMKALFFSLSNDPSLSSLPLLATFLKSCARPFLRLVPPAASKQISTTAEPDSLSFDASNADEAAFPPLGVEAEEDELVEKDICDRLKKRDTLRMWQRSSSSNTRLQEQDRRNHEAYIRSGEIFEDRQQAYEKMTKSYEKLLASTQTLSELLYLPMPALPTSSSTGNSIQIGTSTGGLLSDDADDSTFAALGGKWEDEEERRFFEDTQDLREAVPKNILESKDVNKDNNETGARKNAEDEEVKRLQVELAGLEAPGGALQANGKADTHDEAAEDEDDDAATLTSRSNTPTIAPQGPSQLLTALLARLPDCTNRTLIDQAAVEFTFLNSKTARKRLVKNKYMPDVGPGLIAVLDEEFRRKKNVVIEFAEIRLKLFRLIMSPLILHMFKVCIDEFSGTNIDNLALLLEGCGPGRFLPRNNERKQRFGTMASHVAQSAIWSLTPWNAARADEAQADSSASGSTSDHVA